MIEPTKIAEAEIEIETVTDVHRRHSILWWRLAALKRATAPYNTINALEHECSSCLLFLVFILLKIDIYRYARY